MSLDYWRAEEEALTLSYEPQYKAYGFDCGEYWFNLTHKDLINLKNSLEFLLKE